MRLDPAEARARFAASPVLRLATAGRDGRPHVVPCTFVLDEQGRITIGIDNKPKSTRKLRIFALLAEAVGDAPGLNDSSRYLRTD